MAFQKFLSEHKKTKGLLGAILIKLGTSITSTWGNINLYFLSEFHHQGSKITPQTNAMTLFLSVIPMVLSLLFAIKLCHKYGYILVIRIVSFIFLLSPMVSIFIFDLYSFILFSIVVTGCMFAMSSIPVLNCVWTLFPEHKNKVTALLVVAFGIGGIAWNMLFMHLINPNNQDTTVKGEGMSYFSQEVTQNVRRTAILGFGVTGGITVLGSLLLERNDDPAELSSPKDSQPQQIQTQLEKNTPSSETVKLNSEHQQQRQQFTLSQARKDQKFILIMFISFLTGLYEIHLMMNFKIIYMPLVSDDHFLSYASMLCSLVAIGGAFFWGCLGDMRGVALTTLILSVLDFGSKIFSDFAVSKPMIIVMVILVGLISKSMTTIAGPGFVQYFGLNVGTEMLPYKGVAILLGYVIVPLFQVVTSDHLSPREYLILISFTSIFTLICSVRLFILDRRFKREQNKRKDVEMGEAIQGIQGLEGVETLESAKNKRQETV